MVEIVGPNVRGAPEFGYGLAAGKVGISAITPQIQIVAIRRKSDILKRGIRHRDDELFAIFYPSLADGILNLGSPFPYNNTALALLIYRKAIVTLFLDLHTGAGQVHKVAGGVVHSQNQFPELHFYVTVPPGYISEDNIRIRPEPQEVPFAQLDFDAGIELRNNSITAQEGKVDRHFRPVDIARRFVARFPVNEADSGRVIALSQHRGCHQQGNRCEPKQS